MGYFKGVENARLVTEVFRHDKDRFHPYTAFMAEVMRSSDTLGAVEREAIALHVSAINRCHYCVGSHRAALLAMGQTAEQIAEVEVGRSPDGKLHALLVLAARLTNTPSMVGEADIDDARRAGATDRDIQDTIAVAAVFAFMNRLVEGYGVKGDDKAFDLVGKSLISGGYDAIPKMISR
ncbi:carboxymuconolactone decarboxylase family protein [Lutimaribacter marinistellae]|uniref:Carboxymuconolactone decarboxylase family protein n=1 Tax=Lutimaribacter marinistellae TaxID=1820329 RepID=A0ABV7TDV2_9RHOB